MTYRITIVLGVYVRTDLGRTYASEKRCELETALADEAGRILELAESASDVHATRRTVRHRHRAVPGKNQVPVAWLWLLKLCRQIGPLSDNPLS